MFEFAPLQLEIKKDNSCEIMASPDFFFLYLVNERKKENEH